MNVNADLSGNGSHFKGLYVQWNKLKAVMLKFKSWCTLDINISFDNCSLLKQHLKLYKGYLVNILSNLKRTMISKLLAGNDIYFKSKINQFQFITWRE